jgi:peptidoglycan hydrolase-like protein with peptidoglycan-binding domain
MTRRGVHVIVSDAPVTPARIDHPALFAPRKPLPDGALVSDLELRPTRIDDPSRPVEVAMHVMPPSPSKQAKQAETKGENAPLRILIHRRGEKEILRDAQALLTELGFDAGIPDGVAGPKTRSAIAGFKRWKELPQKGPLLSPLFLTALYRSAGKAEPPSGQLMVRQNFKPLFEAPIGIRQPERALGTHFLIADKVDRETESAEWRAVTLANSMAPRTMKRLGVTAEADPYDPNAAARALDRIDIPEDVRERIDALLSDGASLTITDDGYSPETGKGTDFITITQPATTATTDPKPVKQSGKRKG